MSNIAVAVNSAIANLGPSVRRSAPYLIAAAVVIAVATALFFIIKKAAQLYNDWRAAFKEQVSSDLKVTFEKEKTELTQKSAGDIKAVKQQAATEAEKIKATAYKSLHGAKGAIDTLLPKVLETGFLNRAKKDTAKLVTLIQQNNPLVTLESLLKNSEAFEKVRSEWEATFVAKKEEVVAYLGNFLKGMGTELLTDAEGALTDLCNSGDVKKFVAFIQQKSHPAAEIYGLFKADETEIVTAFRSGDLSEVGTNALKCVETIFGSMKMEIKSLYTTDKAQLEPMIQTLVAKLKAEADGKVAVYLDAFLDKIGIDTTQVVDKTLLDQLKIVVPELVDKGLNEVLKQLTSEKNWAAVVTLLIHFL